MKDNKQKKLKKEILLTCIAVVELIIVYICMITLKINTDSHTQTLETYKNNIVQGSATPKETVLMTPAPTNTSTNTPTDIPTNTPQPTNTPKPDTSDEVLDDATMDLFADSVFIGDSRTEGLQLKTGLSSARFITHRGLTVSSAMTEKVIKLHNGKKGTILEALKESTYKKVFIMFGINELGWPYQATFKNKYEELIASIQKIQPDAEIYVQSIIPVTKKKSDSSDIYNLKNIKKFNKTIKGMAKDLSLTYINAQEAVTKSGSYLSEDASVDGVHLTKSACFKWLNYITDYLLESNESLS